MMSQTFDNAIIKDGNGDTQLPRTNTNSVYNDQGFSLKQMQAGTPVTILTGDWVTSTTDPRYPFVATKQFSNMADSVSFGLIPTATNGIKTALEKIEDRYIQDHVADNTPKTIKFYATAKPTGTLKYLVKGAI